MKEKHGLHFNFEINDTVKLKKFFEFLNGADDIKVLKFFFEDNYVRGRIEVIK